MGEETIGRLLGELSDSRAVRAVNGDLGKSTLMHHLAELIPAGIFALIEASIPEENAPEGGEDDGVNPELSEVERPF